MIDAIETLMSRRSGRFKRLPDTVDAGHAWVSGTYTGESLRRIRDGEGWQDTDDSGADFEIGPPEPGLGEGEGEVTGDPWVALDLAG